MKVVASPATFNIGALSMEGDRKWSLLLKEKYRELQPQISPDGRWMAFASNESGKFEVYVRPYPQVDGGRWQVSTNGGNDPLWSPSGRELFYRNADAVMAVPVKTDTGFSPEAPRILFQANFVGLGVPLDISTWDISPDGKRILMMKEVGAAGEASKGLRRINVVLNWLEELKQRAPVK
jgi:dipeptidyl aminopeptidase/acylaminoacyl peptidase